MPASAADSSGQAVHSATDNSRLYLDRDLELEAISDLPSDQVPVSYDDLPQGMPSGSEADPSEHESLLSEDQSYRETVRWEGVGGGVFLHELVFYIRP